MQESVLTKAATAVTVSIPRAQWKTARGFILAALGAAIGIGNIWRFSYVMGENGGGAFLLVYLVFILVVGVPMMLGPICGSHVVPRPRPS